MFVDADEMKSQALSNAQKAFQDQEQWVCCTVLELSLILLRFNEVTVDLI